MSNPRYVCCLKYGNKYDPIYVNKLYNMVQRNLTLNYRFICFTEDTTGINPQIETRPLPVTQGIKGWWYKPMFYNPELGLNGTILFLDLDLVIFENIDKLFEYKPGEFCIIRDFNRMRHAGFDKFNSSVFRLETGQHSHVYSNFMANHNMICKRYQGDQDWMRHSIKDGFNYWPDEWIQSYKWEMRDNPKLVLDRKKGGRNFEKPGQPKIKPDTSIAVFHGDPNPHKCADYWVAENWR
jgi:hypothetical protein